jgi:hypothetical protein
VEEILAGHRPQFTVAEEAGDGHGAELLLDQTGVVVG